MRTNPVPLEARLDDALFGVDDLCRLAGVELHWVQQRLAEGLLAARSIGPAWHFDGAAVRRVCRIARLERDFDAVPELAALVADLEDEVHRLRARVRRLGG